MSCTASAATGADVPATYFGPTPSTVQKELVGPLQLLTAGKLDQQAATITLPMAALRNAEIADLFDLLGDLYELDGAVVYRVLAYRRAAKRFRETAESVWALSEQGRLTELDDIGDTIATKVGELRDSGTMAALEKLRGLVPDEREGPWTWN